MTAYPPCPRSKMQIHDSAVKAVFPGPVQLLRHAVYAHFMDYQIPVLRGYVFLPFRRCCPPVSRMARYTLSCISSRLVHYILITALITSSLWFRL